MTAGGVGLNLFKASLVVMTEMYFTPGVLAQAEARAHRLGQENPVEIEYLVANGTLDQALRNIVTKKTKVSSRLLDGRIEEEEEADDEEHKAEEDEVDPTIVEAAFAEAAHTVRFADSEGKVSTPITAAQLLQPRRTEDTGTDLWKTFNRVQENTIKGGLTARAQDTFDNRGRRQRGRMVSTRQVKGIDQDVKLNRALWQLAERMAELKGVGYNVLRMEPGQMEPVA